MPEGYEWLTAFITWFGLYKSLVTSFGLQRALATFHNYINDILYNMLDHYVMTFHVDTLIYSRNLKDQVK
jgi:hypothetical protein